jgi:hypothetical protein
MVIGISNLHIFFSKLNFIFMAHKHQEHSAQRQEEGGKHTQKTQKPTDERNEDKESLQSNMSHGQNKKGSEFSNEPSKKQPENSKLKGNRKEVQDADQEEGSNESSHEKKSGKDAAMSEHSSSNGSKKR